MKLGGKVEPSEGKEVSWEIPVSNFSKGAKFSLNWGKQSEQILFEKINVFRSRRKGTEGNAAVGGSPGGGT